jgi:hypothetical protein
MRLHRYLLPVLIAGLIAFVPFAAYAANANFFGPIISDGSNGQADCTCEQSQGAMDWGCVLQTFQNVINLGISLAVIFFVLIFSYAGILLMVSSMNPGNRQKAKNMLGAAVVGFLVAMSAWLLVDFVMKAVYNEGQFGFWNSILDENSGRACIQEQQPPAGPTGSGIEAGSGYEVGDEIECKKLGEDEYTSATVTAVTEPEEGQEGDTKLNVRYEDGTTENQILASRCRDVEEEEEDRPSANWQSYFGFQSGISAQAGHASESLSDLLSCMAGTLQEDGYTFRNEISSISSSGIASGQVSFETCAAQGRAAGASLCPHTVNSCHYGGASCNDDHKSYSVDFGNNDGDRSSILIGAANACGAVRAVNEGDHVHVTAPNRCGTNGATCR